MKRKIIAFMMAAAFLCNPWAHPARDTVSDQVPAAAESTSTVPEGYTPIYTIDDLYAIRNNNTGDYILMNDIDLSETASGGDWDSGNGWTPIGTPNAPFTGTLDGNGYSIKNMHIYGELNANQNYIGLFGVCGNCSIKKLAITDCDIDITISKEAAKSNLYYIGTLLGSCTPSQEMNQLYTSGTINVKEDYSGDKDDILCYVGGIAGRHFDLKNTITNAYNNCSINVECISTSKKVELYVGGLCGSGKMTSSYNMGKVSVTTSPDSTVNYGRGNLSGNGSGLNSYYPKSLNDCSGFGNREDIDADGYNTNIVGLTLGQMKSKAVFKGFDFDTVWTINPNAPYPYPTLRNVPVAGNEVVEPTTEPTTLPTTEPTTEPTTVPPTEPTTVPPTEPTTLKGDINGDGAVNAKDANIILIYAAKVGTGQKVSIDDLY